MTVRPTERASRWMQITPRDLAGADTSERTASCRVVMSSQSFSMSRRSWTACHGRGVPPLLPARLIPLATDRADRVHQPT
jgi:hypothetical protein